MVLVSLQRRVELQAPELLIVANIYNCPVHNQCLVQGFSSFFVLRPISKKVFLGDPLMDSLMLIIRVNVTLVYKNIYI